MRYRERNYKRLGRASVTLGILVFLASAYAACTSRAQSPVAAQPKTTETRYFLASNEMNLATMMTVNHAAPIVPTPPYQTLSPSVVDPDRLHYLRGEELTVNPELANAGFAEYENTNFQNFNPQYEFHVKMSHSSLGPILAFDHTEDFQSEYSASPGQLASDFIYRLSSSDASLGSDTLYEIDYVLNNVKVNPENNVRTATPLNSGTLAITNQLYGSELSSQSSPESDNDPDILTFPRGSRNRYAIARMVIPIDKLNASGLWPTEIVFTLREKNPNADIFIRGFRLLRGQ